jgi:hypothetical protein
VLKIYISEENYAILHKMICDQLDVLLSPFDEVEDYEPTEEHYKILEAVTLFSQQNPNPTY